MNVVPSRDYLRASLLVLAYYVKFYKEYIIIIIMRKGVSFGKMLEDSWNTFSAKFGVFVLLGALFSFLPGVIFGIWDMNRVKYIIDGITPSVGEIIMEIKVISPWIFVLWIFSTLLTVSIIYALNNGTKRKTVDFKNALRGGWNFYANGLILGLLMFVFLVPLYALFLIPGIIFHIYWMFSFYIMVNEKKTVMESLKRSYEIVKGRWWKVFGYIILLYLITGIIGSIISGVFNLFGEMTAIFFQTAAATLISIFSLIFVNNFYLGLKGKNK